MSNLMKFFGAVMAILAVALGIMTFVKPGTMDVYGIKLDTAAILFVGGVLAMGLGGVMDRLAGNRAAREMSPVAEAPAVVPVPASMPNLSRKTAEAATAATTTMAAAVAATEAVAKPATTTVADTISALEQAKADVLKSMGGMDSVIAPPPPVIAPEPMKPVIAAAEPEPTEEEVESEEADPDLYVLEEKVIRGRPARILSDNTVEAETDEGWMRFEDMDHLNEYLDSADETRA